MKITKSLADIQGDKHYLVLMPKDDPFTTAKHTSWQVLRGHMIHVDVASLPDFIACEIPGYWDDAVKLMEDKQDAPEASDEEVYPTASTLRKIKELLDILVFDSYKQISLPNPPYISLRPTAYNRYFTWYEADVVVNVKNRDQVFQKMAGEFDDFKADIKSGKVTFSVKNPDPGAKKSKITVSDMVQKTMQAVRSVLRHIDVEISGSLSGVMPHAAVKICPQKDFVMCKINGLSVGGTEIALTMISEAIEKVGLKYVKRSHPTDGATYFDVFVDDSAAGASDLQMVKST